MKISLFFATLIVASVASRADLRPIEDPPPEPANCPLCGGDAGLHSRVVIAIEGIQAQVLLYALRW